MTNQEIARKILDTQYFYPKSYSNLRQTEHGLLYYNEEIPYSNDANHAVITKYDENTDFDGIIKEIKEFYLSKNLPPMIYSDHIPGQLEKIKDSLIKHGFEFESFNNIYSIHKEEPKVNEPYSLNIKRIDKGDDLSFIFKIWKVNENRQGGADRVFSVAEQRKDWTNYHLFVGYLEDGTPVTAAALEYFDGIGMVDDVETANAYRGKGYARQLTRFWIDYHCNNYNDRLLYVYYENPTAGRIYREAGFANFDWDFESWSAWIDS
jgi:GNAT superfamily N-acetyltransferase